MDETGTILSPRIAHATDVLRPAADRSAAGDIATADGGTRLAWLERFRSAVEYTADMVFITDTRGVIEYVNPAFERATGYPASEALGARPCILKSGLHGEEFYTELWSTILGGSVYRGTIANRRRDGELFHIEQTISPMPDAGGQVSHFVAVGRDVSQERKLQEHENKLRLAWAVQQRFYPATAPRVDGFDIAGAAYPADRIGGDYFDYIPMRGNGLGLAIGDVSGRGLDASLLMSETRAYLRAIAGAFSDVGRVLTLVNRQLCLDIGSNRYVTLLLARLDARTRSLVHASAGHEPGGILRRSGAIEMLNSGGTPLGMFEGVRYETSRSIPLHAGDVVVLSTDGASEAESPDGQALGHERLLRSVHEHRAAPAREIVELLRREIEGFTRGRSQADDVTLVVCKCV